MPDRRERQSNYLAEHQKATAVVLPPSHIPARSQRSKKKIAEALDFLLFP
jgi:hypothetical protein